MTKTEKEFWALPTREHNTTAAAEALREFHKWRKEHPDA